MASQHAASVDLVVLDRPTTPIAVILDVVVALEARGLGALLMDTIVGDPRLVGVVSFELSCQPDLMPFYRRWGFTEHVGRSRLMRRTTDSRLVAPYAHPNIRRHAGMM